MPSIRADIIDAYVFRRRPEIELLQLRRVGDPMAGTWQPVMGHVESGESAVACLWREVREETGLVLDAAVGAWSLEQVHPFFLAELDAIVMSARFAVEVDANWVPALNHEHDSHRWVPVGQAESAFLWPGQHATISELASMLACSGDRLDHCRVR